MSNKKLCRLRQQLSAAALLLGGAYAWRCISQTALNKTDDVITGKMTADIYGTEFICNLTITLQKPSE